MQTPHVETVTKTRSPALTALLFAAALVAACGGGSTAADPCASVTCSPSDKCHTAGSCNATTGACSAETAKVCSSGQTCDNADGVCKSGPNLCAGVTCSASDLCHVAGTCGATTGTCSAQTPKSCASGQTCDNADGMCKPIDLCAGVTCTATDLCHVAGTCSATTGTCSAQTPMSCATGQACDNADGMCKPIDLCAGVTCTATDLCHVAGTCSSSTGTCSAQTAKSCASGQTCDVADGICKGGSVAVPKPQVAKVLGVAPPLGVAVDLAGVSYVGGGIYPPGSQSFDGITVTPATVTGGDLHGDVLLARYNAATHKADWALAFGDASEQIATGVAVTNDGTLAAIGNFSGSLTFGTSTISNAGSTQIDFLAGVAASNGSGQWALKFNDGQNAKLTAIAANPASATNRIAICGYTDTAATDLVPGATFGGGTKDLIIGVFSSAGTKLWSAQIGGANEEECDAIAVDDNGDVYAAGKFDGALSFTGTALSTPNSSTRAFVWVAKFKGADGTALAQASFGNGPTGKAAPTAIAVDSSGKVVVAGNFTIALPFGGTTLTSAGSLDAFVAKLDPAASTAFAPIWAVRMGGPGADSASSVALNSHGDAVAAGLFRGTSTGAAALTANGAASDAFLLHLDAAAGSTVFAAGYGDVATQQADSIAINRSGTGAAQDVISLAGTLNGSVTFPDPAGTVTAASSTAEAFLVFAQFLQ